MNDAQHHNGTEDQQTSVSADEFLVRTCNHHHEAHQDLNCEHAKADLEPVEHFLREVNIHRILHKVLNGLLANIGWMLADHVEHAVILVVCNQVTGRVQVCLQLDQQDSDHNDAATAARLLKLHFDLLVDGGVGLGESHSIKFRD